MICVLGVIELGSVSDYLIVSMDFFLMMLELVGFEICLSFYEDGESLIEFL